MENNNNDDKVVKIVLVKETTLLSIISSLELAKFAAWLVKNHIMDIMAWLVKNVCSSLKTLNDDKISSEPIWILICADYNSRPMINFY